MEIQSEKSESLILIDARQALFLERQSFKNFLQSYLRENESDEGKLSVALNSSLTEAEKSLGLKGLVNEVNRKLSSKEPIHDERLSKCLLNSVLINKDLKLFFQELACHLPDNNPLAERCKFFFPYSSASKREYYETLLTKFDSEVSPLVTFVEKVQLASFFKENSSPHALVSHRLDQFEGLCSPSERIYFFASTYNKEKKEKLERAILDLPSVSSLNQVPSMLSFLKQMRASPKESFVLRVGYCVKPKKLQLFCQNQVLYSKYPTQMIPLDLRYEFAYDLHALFHKISDFTSPRSAINDFQGEMFLKMYALHGKRVAFVDPPDNMDVYRSRVDFQNTFERLFSSEEFRQQAQDLFKSHSQPPVKILLPKISVVKTGTPLEELLENIQKQSLKFPFILKTIVACTSKASHTMAVALNEKGLEEALKHNIFSSQDFIIQELINHDERIFKVYVIEYKTLINSKQSIPNLDKENVGGNSFFFDSQQPFKDQLEFIKQRQNFILKDFSINEDFVALIVKTITEKLRFSFYGIDIVRETGSGEYYLVDCNYLPGYKNLPDLQTIFHNHFRDMFLKLQKH